jgi:murein L,D-transpeptidase YafK
MQSGSRGFAAGRGLAFLVLSFGVLLFLPSCSLNDSNIRVPVSQVQVPTCPSVEAPQLPYAKIDLEYPLSSVNSPQLYVMKGNRRLLVVNDGVLVRDYLCGLGPSPQGDKRFSGDGKTPEGDFYICVKNRESRFYKSFGLSYPDVQHAGQALLEGKIGMGEYRQISSAVERRSVPPWNTPLGGAIMIHGGGGYEDWTKGCIAVSNSAMDELFQVIDVGTSVKVLP